MTKTNWQDPKTGEIISPHISGLQEAVGKLEESVGLNTVFETDIPMTEVFISNDDRCRIYQAPEGKRNWLLSPTPSISKNGVVITDDFEIDYGGGAVVFTTPLLPSDTLTADVTYTKRIEGKQLSTNDYSDEEKLKNQNNKDDILNLSETVGDTTIDDTLVPTSDTGLSVKILLSWLANMIKSITGKASWRIKPTKNMEELNTALTTHEAEKVHQYEEGAWTPTIDFGGASIGITYATRSGRYRRIGNIVSLSFDLVLSSKGTSIGTLSIGGLPFKSLSTPPYNAGSFGRLRFIDVGGKLISSNLNSNTTAFQLHINSNDGTSDIVLNDTHMQNTSWITGSLVYHI